MVPVGEPPDSSDSNANHEPRILPIQSGSRTGVGSISAAPSKRIMFRSQVMNELITKASRFARSSAAVLITGESGTGKELLSRLIHSESARSQFHYVTVNCAALPEMLVESEFFGHERGAFTGAFQQRIGHFQHAHRGTILLDEISEIPISIQAKLLRVIEEQEVLRVGGIRPEKIDVRIVATSNRNLQQDVNDGSFRLDLYHRLSVLRLEIPPLRQRIEDIPLLSEHFLELYRDEASSLIRGISPAAMKLLCEHTWPGNIRELRNVIHCASIECQADYITPECLSGLKRFPESTPDRRQPLFEVEKESILASLKKHHGVKTAAAAELGVTARTLTNKLKRYKAA